MSYLQPKMHLESYAVCEWEIKTALRVAKERDDYIIIVALDELEHEKFKAISWNKFSKDLTDMLYVNVETKKDPLNNYREIAQILLSSKVDKIDNIDEWQINLYTRAENFETAKIQQTIDIDLSYYFKNDKIPAEQEWQQIIMAWLYIKEIISNKSKKILLNSNAHLSVGFTFGRIFHAATRYEISFADQTNWTTKGSIIDRTPLKYEFLRGDKAGSDIIIEIAITRDTKDPITDYINKHELDYKEWHCFMANEFKRDCIKDAQQAYDMMRQVSDNIRNYSDKCFWYYTFILFRTVGFSYYDRALLKCCKTDSVV